MVCCAEQNIQLWPAEGTSGKETQPSPLCATTSAGCFIGDITVKTLEEKRKANLKAVQKHRQTEKFKITIKRYYQSKKCKAMSKRRYIRYPERFKAKQSVNYAVIINKIPHIKTRRCYFCFEQAQEYHHYKGYERKFWLEVIPVCIKCHTKIHKGVA